MRTAIGGFIPVAIGVDAVAPLSGLHPKNLVLLLVLGVARIGKGSGGLTG